MLQRLLTFLRTRRKPAPVPQVRITVTQSERQDDQPPTIRVEAAEE